MPKGLRYGFKAEAERVAARVRADLGLSARERLDPHGLAAHLGIEVLPLTALQGDVRNPRSIRLAASARARFSAVTICDGDARLIIYNPAHPPGRRANSLAHELAHVLLKHQPRPALGPLGCRRWDDTQEAEADWLAATLLVPREGALWWMARGGTIQGGAEHFGVSEALFRWRVNQTGVPQQLAASRRRKPSFSSSLHEAVQDLSHGKPRRSETGRTPADARPSDHSLRSETRGRASEPKSRRPDRARRPDD